MPNREATNQEKWIATWRFLTVFPAPQAKKKAVPQLAMFPLVGLALGFIFYISTWLLSSFATPIVAFIILCLWLKSTGFLHLDGLADLVDGLAASHSETANNDKMLAVMKEPHIASFAVIALIILILGKYVALFTLFSADVWVPLLLIPAWARLGGAWWAYRLPPLTDGLASWCKQAGDINLAPWFVVLLFLSLIFAPMLLFAPLVLWLWKWFLETKLQGMNGDCLGAGIEMIELLLLLWVCLSL